jgi:hypothetical protein
MATRPFTIDTNTDPALLTAQQRSGSQIIGNTSVIIANNTHTIDAGENVVVVTTDQEVFVTVNEENFDQNFITNQVNNVGGGDGQVQYNANGSFAGDSTFTFSNITKVLTVGGLKTDTLLYSNGQPWNTGGGNAEPGGTNGQLQFNDAGAFNGVPGVTWANARLNLGVLSNLSISGGSSGQVLTTNGSGVLSWTTPAAPYGDANVAAYLPTYTGNVGANWIKADYVMGNANPLYYIPGANVVGAVPSATVAGSATVASSANSVALANVAGAGNIASINLSGSSSNVLYGNGTWAPVSGGNSANANYANFAGTAYSVDGANVDGVVANADFSERIAVEAVNNNYSYHVVLTTGPGDSTLHNDVDDSFQYNPADGILTVTRVDTDYLQVSQSVLSNLVPFDSLPLSLGNVTNPWQNIHAGNATLTGTGTALNVSSGNILTNQVTGTAFNFLNGLYTASITGQGATSNYTLNLPATAGSNGQVLSTDGTGNLSWINAGGGGNTGNVTFNDINIIGTGNLHLQPDPANTSSYLDIFLTSGPDLHLVASAAANLILGKDDAANVMTSWDGNVYVQSWNNGSNAQGGVWTFGGDGTLTVPQNIHGNGALQLQGLANGNTTINIGSGVGGDIDMVSNLGNINLYTASNQPWIFDQGGNLTAPGAIKVGNMSIGTVPGDITANNNTTVAFNVTGSDGGFLVNYLDEVGNANTSGGELAFNSETGNATYRISLSDDLGDGFATKIWRFDGTGNLVLAGGNSVIQSIANSSLDPTNPNVSTMTLMPDANYGSQVLVLDPTAPGHIHLRAYAFSNIDEPSANIFLGGEDTAFEITSGPNNEARIHSNNYTWTFNNDGNLQVAGDVFANTGASPAPALYGFSSLQVYDSINVGGVTINSTDGTNGQVLTTYGNGVTYWSTVSGGGGTPAGSNNQIQFNSNGAFAASGNYTFADTVGGGTVTVGNELVLLGNGTIGTANSNLNIQPAGNLIVTASASNWKFDTAGNLTLPGNTFSVNYANGSQASAPLVDVLNTNGLTTVYYPTFVENRTTGQTVRADQDFTYRTDTNTLTVGNITVNSQSTLIGNSTTGANAVIAGITNTILPNSVAAFSANVNNYTQVTLQNKSTGADATADFVATADNGSDTVNYLDLGIINSGYDNNTPTNSLGNIVFAADSYLYAQGNVSNTSQAGGNLAIGTTVAGKTVKIFAGGTNSSSIVANIANTGIAVTGNLSVSGNISGNTAGFAIGYRDIPQVAASNATIGLSDAGKHFYSTTAGNLTLTIPLNSTTAFPTGTAINIVVQAAGNVLVNAASGVTLYLAGNSTAANRVVGTYGMATLLKVATDTWFINGTGVS